MALPNKTQTILQQAIADHAAHLLTSDEKHFAAHFWQIVEGIAILGPPREAMSTPIHAILDRERRGYRLDPADNRAAERTVDGSEDVIV
jgi:hypothetical protein